MCVSVYESLPAIQDVPFVTDIAIIGFAFARPRLGVSATAEDTQPAKMCDYYTFSCGLSSHKAYPRVPAF